MVNVPTIGQFKIECVGCVTCGTCSGWITLLAAVTGAVVIG